MMNNEKLKKVLEERSIEQQELAQAVGVSQAFMSYVINGLKDPSVAVLKRMADYLKMSVDELI